MKWPSVAVAVATAAVTAHPVAAQRPDYLQVHGIVTTAAEEVVAVGVGLVLRPSTRPVGAVVSVSAGGVGGRVGARVEGIVTYRVVSSRRRGVHWYGGGGVALVATDDRLDEFMVLTAGVESAAAMARGWFAEAGFGGGARVSLGWRFRI